MNRSLTSSDQIGGLEIAIIGMNCRAPGANNLDEFWRNLRDAKESITRLDEGELRAAGVPEAMLKDPRYVRVRTKIDRVGFFDAAFFGFSPREAELMDPQQRLFMECAWEVLESAGYDPYTYKGLIGVYAGLGKNGYLNNLLAHEEIIKSTNKWALRIGNDPEYLATHTSYKLNLKGPSLNVQSACSTSLVAVHLACQGILDGECDMALAGGVALQVPLLNGYLYEEGGTTSPDGHCRAFDHQAQGTVPGQGVGIVLLKRLADALADGDCIDGVIKGSAINNDGSLKVSFTAPSIEGQAQVITAAQAVADVDPESISYIETHGTGTPLGDPIEMAALNESFCARTGRKQFCAIGSVKTNIGHAGEAAGVIGLIKVVLALKRRQIPASLNFERPNPQIDFENSPFFVNTELREWEGPLPLRAGVSSFGFGGTNAHVIVEESPDLGSSGESRPVQLIALSARTAGALERAGRNLAEHLRQAEDVCLADVAYTLHVGRHQWPHRLVTVCRDREEAIAALSGENSVRVRRAVAPESQPEIVFLFPGRVASLAGMGRELYDEEAAFRQLVDACFERLRPALGVDLLELYRKTDQRDGDPSGWGPAAMMEPALFVIEYALARLWMSWGINPQAVIGHGVGEYAAACVAGVMSVEDALRLVVLRGRLLDEQTGHLQMTKPLPKRFGREVRKIKLCNPHLPYSSGVSGGWVTANEITNPTYWERQLREPAHLGAGVRQILQEPGARVFLEVGPGEALSGRLRRLCAEAITVGTADAEQEKLSLSSVLLALGDLWLAGVHVDWNIFYDGQRRRRVPLPTYPFERQLYWIDPSRRTGPNLQSSWPINPKAEERQIATSPPRHARPALSTTYLPPTTETEVAIAGIWQELLGIAQIGIHDNFFEMGGNSLIAVQVSSRIHRAFAVDLPIRTVLTAGTIAQLAKAVVAATVAPPSETSFAVRGRLRHFPLSYAQRRLWFIDQFEKSCTEYNLPQALRLRGELDRHALERTVAALAERHEVLRTRFVEENGEPVQVIDPELRIKAVFEDLTLLDAQSQHESLAVALRNEWAVPFDLAQGPLWRVKLIKLGPRDHVLVWTFHHIIFDGWSQSIFNRELATLYEAFHEGRENPLPPLPLQYVDYVLWQRESMSEENIRRELSYWMDQLAGIPEELKLPQDRPRGAEPAFAGSMFVVSLSADQVAALRQFGRTHDATLYMTLLAVFAVLLQRYSGQEDIVVGSPVANRRRAELEELIGFFVNILVMRVRAVPEHKFRQLLSEVRGTALDAYLHQDLPFERLVAELLSKRRLNVPPIHQVIFAHAAAVGAQELKGLVVERLGWDEFKVRFDLEVHAFESEGELTLSWLYNRDLFDCQRIEQMARHYVRLLQAAVADADKQLCALEMLEEAERQELLGRRADVRTAPADARCLHEIFEEQVSRRPDATAVVSGDESLSYAELNGRANQAAHRLRRSGVAPESRVALCVERGPDQIIGLLAILKAGGVYVPLDPDYPQERLSFIVVDSDPRVILTCGKAQARLPRDGAELILLDNREEFAGEPRGDVKINLCRENAAYVIYTSGSTGRPKGVVVPHGNVVRLFESTERRFAFNDQDVWSMFHSYAFDFSVWELWGALLYGGRLIVVPRDVSRSSEAFLGLLTDERVTVLNQTPTAFRHLARAEEERCGQNSAASALRVVIFGGESLEPRALDSWMERHGDERPRLINMYGITETTVHVTYCEVRRAECKEAGSRIGTPIDDLTAYVLDERMELVPKGVEGEIYVGGAGLARGYLNRPSLTAAAFVADPFGAVPGTRLYRSGDLARRRFDSGLEYLGRRDQQVKLRGFRIELGEIEAVLRQHPQVRDSLVIKQGEGDGARLVCYVLRREGEADQAAAQTSQIREWQQLYESTYSQVNGSPGDFNIVGWQSSYTGEMIPSAEMRVWVEETIAQLRPLGARRVLEIGCGTGLLLTRLAPDCDSYVGLDFSAQVLDQLRGYLSTRTDLGHVELKHGLAHELSFMPEAGVDLVILNSVVQYFPDTDYLLDVLNQAVRVTRRGGHIFIGDVRSLPLANAYYASVQLHKAAGHTSLEDLRRLIQQAKRKEEELLLDPELFVELTRRWEKLGSVETWLKAGAYDNELSRFRYDVILRLGEKEEPVDPQRWVVWDEAGRWRDTLREALAQSGGGSVGVRAIRDGRVAAAVAVAMKIEDAESVIRNAEELRTHAASIRGEDPNVVMQLARILDVGLSWRGFRPDGVYDAIFRPRRRRVRELPDVPYSYYLRYANAPAQTAADVEVGRVLHEYLRRQLPEYLVPSSVVALRSWPLTPNGKLDRKALPDPELMSATAYHPPRTSEEEVLCALFAEVLGLQRVGIRDDFFALGGHSLLAARLVSRIRTFLSLDVSIRSVFESPVIADLAERLKTAEKVRAPKLQRRSPRSPI